MKILYTISPFRQDVIDRKRNVAHNLFLQEGSLNKSLHPAAIGVAAVVFISLLAFVFMKFGSGDVKGVSLAESMKIDANATNAKNSITGEPLLPDQLVAQEKQREMIRNMQAAGADPRKNGTVPNFQGNAH